jgi:hypothetical protein
MIRRPMTKQVPRKQSTAEMAPPASRTAAQNGPIRAESHLNNPSYNSLSSLDDTTFPQFFTHLNRGHEKDHAEEMRDGDTTEEVFEVRWEAQYEAFDCETEKKGQKLASDQRLELEGFETLWREQMPNRYRKPSANLLQIKQIERAMAISGQYDRARAMHAEAEKLAAREAEELQANLIRDYRIAKEQLMRTQRAERDKLESDRGRLRTVLDADKKSEETKRKNRRNVIEQRQSESLRLLRERSIQNQRKICENGDPPLVAANEDIAGKEDGPNADGKET